MTPLELQLLLDLHMDGPDGVNPSATTVIRDAIDGLFDCEIIKTIPGDTDKYELTERGKMHVQQLCELKWPTQKWVDANGNLMEDE